MGALWALKIFGWTVHVKASSQQAIQGDS